MKKFLASVLMILFLFTSASFVLAETPYKDLLDHQVTVISYSGVYEDVTYMGYTEGTYIFRSKNQEYGQFLVFEDTQVKNIVPVTVSTD